ncbi:hypothetical protein [Streptomyces sp. 7N604]|uniref:hypothetical protein n=1 Tax=Streptomyces sp. 7N604 TaxID=3457415 RepID=UPI003FCF2BA8
MDQNAPTPWPVQQDSESPQDIVARAPHLAAGNVDAATLAFIGSSLEGIVGH